MLEILLGITGTAFIGTIGWLFVAQSETNAKLAILQQNDVNYVTLLDAKFETVEVGFNDLGRRLDRIEKAMNGAFTH